MGPSLSFFTGATNVLIEIHGNRIATPEVINRVANALGMAEAAFLELESAPDSASERPLFRPDG